MARYEHRGLTAKNEERMITKGQIPSINIMPYSLFRLGAAGHYVDIEDLFLFAYKLAPETFSWRTYGFPCSYKLQGALRRFESSHPGFVLRSTNKRARQLTAEGVGWTRERLAHFESVLGGEGSRLPIRRGVNKQILDNLQGHHLIRDFAQNKTGTLPQFEVAEMLMCSCDSPKTVWRERLATYRSAAKMAEKEDELRFLDYLGYHHADWFGIEERA